MSATATVESSICSVEDLPSSTSTGAHGRMAAEVDDERFELLTEAGQPLGMTERRAVVHAKGLWHRAVYCFVRDSRGALLIQRRSLGKKVGPGQWDLSVAEHLSPGESYQEAVIRGLEEELGIVASSGFVSGPLCPTHPRKLALPEKGIYDNEFVESYQLLGYEGPLDVNAEEVSEVRWVTLTDLQREMEQEPEQFTVWFREELVLVLPTLLEGATKAG